MFILYWLPVLVVFAGNIFAFFFCQIKKDNSYIDIFWGPTFITPLITVIILRVATGQLMGLRVWLVVSLVAAWGTRLAIHIGRRHKGEDFRYIDMRVRWMEEGITQYYLKAFFFIFMLQAVFSLIVNGSAMFVCIYTTDFFLGFLDYLGIAVWLFGFLFEVIGDYQLQEHISDQTEGKSKFIKSGLWRITRHPNYFGEAVLWWGIWLIACSNAWGWTTVFAPIFITLLVRFVSGVPLLEKKYAGNLEWEQYCQETSVFVPWMPTQYDPRNFAIFRSEVDAKPVKDNSE